LDRRPSDEGHQARKRKRVGVTGEEARTTSPAYRDRVQANRISDKTRFAIVDGNVTGRRAPAAREASDVEERASYRATTVMTATVSNETDRERVQRRKRRTFLASGGAPTGSLVATSRGDLDQRGYHGADVLGREAESTNPDTTTTVNRGIDLEADAPVAHYELRQRELKENRSRLVVGALAHGDRASVDRSLDMDRPTRRGNPEARRELERTMGTSRSYHVGEGVYTREDGNTILRARKLATKHRVRRDSHRPNWRTLRREGCHSQQAIVETQGAALDVDRGFGEAFETGWVSPKQEAMFMGSHEELGGHEGSMVKIAMPTSVEYSATYRNKDRARVETGGREEGETTLLDFFGEAMAQPEGRDRSDVDQDLMQGRATKQPAELAYRRHTKPRKNQYDPHTETLSYSRWSATMWKTSNEAEATARPRWS
jgi:hypothetical protein